uniref:Uncharacterized protein n=1 Tax=Romanomermis culicivorax TaxID=13658 RepID=A0A915JAU3_ROMCU
MAMSKKLFGWDGLTVPVIKSDPFEMYSNFDFQLQYQFNKPTEFRARSLLQTSVLLANAYPDIGKWWKL